MRYWEAYVLGTLGLILVVAAIATQVVALVNDRPWTAALYSVGVIAGALMYRWGYRILARSGDSAPG